MKSKNTKIDLDKNSQLKALIASNNLNIDLYNKSNAVIEGDAENSRIRIDNNATFESKNLTVKNTGNFDGDEVVQLYISQEGKDMPIKELKGFKRIHLKKGEQQAIQFNLKASDIQHYDEQIDDLATIPGKIKLMIGSSSADAKMVGAFDLK